MLDSNVGLLFSNSSMLFPLVDYLPPYRFLIVYTLTFSTVSLHSLTPLLVHIILIFHCKPIVFPYTPSLLTLLLTDLQCLHLTFFLRPFTHTVISSPIIPNTFHNFITLTTIIQYSSLYLGYNPPRPIVLFLYIKYVCFSLRPC